MILINAEKMGGDNNVTNTRKSEEEEQGGKRRSDGHKLPSLIANIKSYAPASQHF